MAMSTADTCRSKVGDRNETFVADQRGAVAFEMPFVFGFMILVLLLPLADMAIAGFQFISAWGALRSFGQSIQYSPPLDVTNASTWIADAIKNADPDYPIPIQSFRILCGDNNAACSSGNTASPKYYSYATTVTLAPMTPMLKPVMCPNGNCTYTLPYSERFQ
jgi:hypothetical protein